MKTRYIYVIFLVLLLISCSKKSKKSENITGVWKVSQVIQNDEKTINDWLKEPTVILEPEKNNQNDSRSNGELLDPAKALLYNKIISAFNETQKIEITPNEIISYDRNGNIIDSEKYSEIKKIQENEFVVIFSSSQKNIKLKLNGNVCYFETPLLQIKLIKE